MKDKIKIVKGKIRTFLRDQDGLTIVEYAVAGGLIAAAVALAFENLGLAVDGVIVTLEGFIAP